MSKVKCLCELLLRRGGVGVIEDGRHHCLVDAGLVVIEIGTKSHELIEGHCLQMLELWAGGGIWEAEMHGVDGSERQVESGNVRHLDSFGEFLGSSCGGSSVLESLEARNRLRSGLMTLKSVPEVPVAGELP